MSKLWAIIKNIKNIPEILEERDRYKQKYEIVADCALTLSDIIQGHDSDYNNILIFGDYSTVNGAILPKNGKIIIKPETKGAYIQNVYFKGEE